MKASCPSLIEQTGDAVVSARHWHSVISNMSGASIQLEVSRLNGHLSISDEDGETTIPVLAADPALFRQNFPSERLREVGREELMAKLSEVAYAMSKTTAKPSLWGACWSAEHIAAADGHRMAMVPIPGGDTDRVIPRPALLAVLQTLKNMKADTIQLSLGETGLYIKAGSTEILTRYVESAFPDFVGVATQSPAVRCVADRSSLLFAVKRALAVYESSESQRLSLTIDEERVAVRGSSQGGDSVCEVEAEANGKILVELGGGYLADALNAIDEERVELRLRTPLDPVILSGGGGHIHLVMPMRPKEAQA